MTLQRRVVLAAVAIAAMTPHTPAKAQSYFGQNQVQYDQFHWQVKQTEHFLIYYYPEEAQAATDAARMAERAYARLSRVLRPAGRGRAHRAVHRSGHARAECREPAAVGVRRRA